MSSTAAHTTVDITDLGFDTYGADKADVTIASTGTQTHIEVAHADDIWSLTFDADGTCVAEPGYTTPPWLVPVIKAATPLSWEL